MSDSIIQHFYTPTHELQNSLHITWCGKRKYAPNQTLYNEAPQAYHLYFITNGKGTLFLEQDTTKSLSRGDMILLFPGQTFSMRANEADPWELMWACFKGTPSQTLLEPLSVTPSNPVLLNALNHSNKHTMDELLSALADTQDPLRSRAVGLLYILIAELTKASKSNGQRVQSVKKEDIIQKSIVFIEENYDTHLDVDTLCKNVSYSRSYLSREFKRRLGMSIPEYINYVRVQNAKLLISETNLSIQEICYSVGMKDCFYFSKIFKKITGYSPAAYKRCS